MQLVRFIIHHIKSTQLGGWIILDKRIIDEGSTKKKEKYPLYRFFYSLFYFLFFEMVLFDSQRSLQYF